MGEKDKIDPRGIGRGGDAGKRPKALRFSALHLLPRYSPDLNPIEQVFAKPKTLLRKTDPRTQKSQLTLGERELPRRQSVVVHARPNRDGRIIWNGARRLGAVILLGRPVTLPIRFCR